MFIIGKIKLNRHHAHIIIIQRPYVSIFSLVKIYKCAGKPVILFTCGVFPLVKILFVFGISLAANFYAADQAFIYCREIYIQAIKPSDGAAAPQPAPPADARPALRRLQDLPGPPGWPVLGNLPQVEPARFHLQLGEWARQYGRFFKLRMANRQLLVAADHEAVAAVLRDRPDGFRRTDRLEAIGLEMGLKPGLFGVNGDAWPYNNFRRPNRCNEYEI